MRPDSSVVKAIEAAVAADPLNPKLRLHLAGLLLDSEDPQRALDQVSKVLETDPANAEALSLAASAAEQAGDKIRAHGYRKLHEALGWSNARNLIGGTSTPEEGPPEPSPKIPLYEEPNQAEPSGIGMDMERPTVQLADVAGLQDVKKRLELSFLGPMRNPDMRKLYGKSLKGGLLLYGPPGCGKTFIARAVAGELGARFLALDLTDVIDMYIGQSERNLHELFESARRNAPCVIFIDEIDALGRKRSLQRGHAGRNVVNQLLAELDGAQFDNEGIYVLAATNHPWDVDSALRRPGRLDRTVLVLPPDRLAREAIIGSSLADRPTEKLDIGWVAERTEDFSGADLAHLCESAVEYAMQDSIASGSPRPVSMSDLKHALKDVRPSIRPWLDTARNHVLYANEGGMYDQLADYLRLRKLL